MVREQEGNLQKSGGNSNRQDVHPMSNNTVKKEDQIIKVEKKEAAR